MLLILESLLCLCVLFGTVCVSGMSRRQRQLRLSKSMHMTLWGEAVPNECWALPRAARKRLKEEVGWLARAATHFALQGFVVCIVLFVLESKHVEITPPWFALYLLAVVYLIIGWIEGAFEGERKVAQRSPKEVAWGEEGKWHRHQDRYEAGLAVP